MGVRVEDAGVIDGGQATALRSFTIRRLQVDDVPDLFNLHAQIIRTLPDPELFRENVADFFAEHMGARGHSIGVFSRGALVAYALIRYPGMDPDNLGVDLDLPKSELASVAHIEECGVHPAFRGYKLQLKLIRLRMKMAAAANYRHVAATVSPRNPYSLANLLECNLHARAVARKYGGKERLVMHLDLLAVPVLHWTNSVGSRLCDLTRVDALLRRGYRGYRYERNAEGGVIHLGEPARIPRLGKTIDTPLPAMPDEN